MGIFSSAVARSARKSARRAKKRRAPALDRRLRFEPLEDRALLSTTWYVAAAGGSNSYTGQAPAYTSGANGPFLTIQQAANSAKAGDTVEIETGTYRETVTPLYSGTSGAPITYKPYNGENVVVYGANLLPLSGDGWTLYNGGADGPIYETPMNWSYNNADGNNDLGDQVFVDGQMMNYARWPNTSLDVSNPTKAVAAAASTTATASTPLGTVCSATYTDAALDAFPASFWVGATIHENGTAAGQGTGTVTSSAPGSVTFSFVYQGADPGAGDTFYLDGGITLDGGGAFNPLTTSVGASAEWYLDTSTTPNYTLYLWTPTGDSPANHVVEAKARAYGFELSGLSYIDIEGINLFACSIDTSSASTHDTINGIKALYVSTFELESAGASLGYSNWGLHMEDTGIIIQGSGNTLENSEIGYSAGNGVTLMGNNASFGAGNVVTNCLIHDVDYMALDCGGVNTGWGPGTPGVYGVDGGGPATSTYNTISDNTIYNCGRSILLIRNMGSGLVLNNDLYDGMLQSRDGGGIYTFQQNGQAPAVGSGSPGPDTVIAYNCIHDMPVSGDVGIYLDNSSSNYVVDHNLTYNVCNALTLNLTSQYNLVYNNTLAGEQSISVEPGSSDGTGMAGTYIENNIFTALYGPVTNLNGATDYVFSNNLLAPTLPGFKNPAALDFQLLPNSAAVDAGMIIPGYTNGYVGSAPDIGCFEYGATPWIAGASAATNVYAAAVPAAPLDLAAASPAASQMDLTWQNNDANATSCVVQWAADEAFTPTNPFPGYCGDPAWTAIVCLPGSAASYVDTTLGAGYYRVCTYNGSYLSTYSNYVYASSAPVVSAGTIEAVNFSAASGVAASGGVLTNCNVGNWAEYANVNFPAGVNAAGPNAAINQITVCYSSTAAAGNSIEFFADGLSGTLLGTVTTQCDPAGGFFTTTIDIGDLVAANGIAAGPHNVYLEFAGKGNDGENVANIQWFAFSAVAMPAPDATWAVNYTATGPAGSGVYRLGSGNQSWPGCIGNCNNGGWVQYADVYIPAGVNQLALQYSGVSGTGDYIQFRLDGLGNPIIAQDTTRAAAGEICTDTVGVSGVAAGVHDVYIEFVQNGSGPFSGVCNLYWFQFGDASPVAAPAGAAAAAAPGLAINVSWSGNSSATGFKIERSTDDQTFIQVGTIAAVAGTSNYSFTDTEVSSGTTDYYRVRAYDENYGNSAYSNVAGGEWTPQAFSLDWNGGASGVWGVGDGGWLYNGSAAAWSNGYIAVFNGASPGAATISGAVSPVEIDFDSSGCSLSGGSISLPYGGGVVCVNAASAAIASPITDGGSPSSLTKTGPGALLLSGSSGYSGETNVLAGTLTVNGALATNGAVVVQSGATLTGDGTIGTLYVAPAATLLSGNNGSGALTTASVQLFGGCTLNYELGTGSGQDGLVTVNSQLALVWGVAVSITPGGDWSNGMYPLFYLPNISSITTPTTLNLGWTILGANLGGYIYSLVATGNDVDLDVQAVNGQWAASGGGAFAWNSAGNWQGGIAPDGVGDTALLGAVVGGGTATITLGAAETLSSLTFSPGAGGSYVLSGSGADALQLANGGNAASISVVSGSDAINAPVVLDNNLNVTAASGTSLTISGAVSGGGGLTLSGGGSLTLSGSDSYTGGTTISGGTLTVASPAALPGSGLVTIGSGGRLVLGNGSGIGSALAASAPVAASDATMAGDAAAANDAAAAITATASTATATPGAIAWQQAIASPGAVFGGPRAADAVAAPSAPTEAVRVAALAGVVVPSPPLSKPKVGETVCHLSPAATPASGASVKTPCKTASPIDVVHASHSRRRMVAPAKEDNLTVRIFHGKK